MNKTIIICPKRGLMTGIKYSILAVFLSSVLLSPDSLAQPPCKKVYIVIDGGDKKWPGRSKQREATVRDADSIAKWLENKGFKGKTLSPTTHPRDKELERLIKSYGKELECPPGSQCCHELFIYIIGHGGPDHFRLWDKGGKSGPIVSYAKLASWLEKLPPCVKLTIFIESCYSGGAIKHLKPPLCKKFGKCGVTIITTADEESIASPGVKVKGASSSGTQDFMKGADKDTDGDGDKGDIKDRWEEMERKWRDEKKKITKKGRKLGNPKMEMCDGQKRMCSLEKPGKKIGLLPPKGHAQLVAFVAVKEGEKVQVAQQIGGGVVATVLVNDELRELPDPDEAIPVSPGDVVQLIGTVGSILGYFTFTPEDETAHPPGTTPVVEAPPGQPTVVSVPGDYTNTAIDDMVVTTTPVETALTTGPEAAPAVAAPEGEAVAGPPSGLEPALKTDDTVVAAGNLDDSAIGSNEVTVTDKTTGKMLGETQVDTWRLAGASLNPPVVNKGQDTNLRLNIYGPPDMQIKVTATADEGLTPREVTATAPLGVLQSQGIGSFTATKSGTHNVKVQASPVMGLPAWR